VEDGVVPSELDPDGCEPVGEPGFEFEFEFEVGFEFGLEFELPVSGGGGGGGVDVGGGGGSVVGLSGGLLQLVVKTVLVGTRLVMVDGTVIVVVLVCVSVHVKPARGQHQQG